MDLRASSSGHARTGNFSVDAAPTVIKGQPEHITLTIFGFMAASQAYQPWRIDIAALDPAGRVLWHEAPFDDAPTFTCLVSQSNACRVGSYKVEMPTIGVAPGVYVIRPSFVLSAGSVLASQPTPPAPPFTLPSLTIEVAD